MGWFDPVGWAKAGVNFVEDKASDAWDDAKDVASSAADTASNAASDAWDGLAGAAKTVEQAPAALIHLGSDAIDAISHPMATAQAMIGGISRGANAVSHFVGDHGSEILTGLEIGGNVALTASGLGPIAGGLIAAGFAAADGIAHGKSADDVIVNSLVAGADKVLPGSGHATEAVVKGIEHGESAQQIVHEAGLDGVGAIAGPALDSAARFVDDLAHGRSPGRVFLDGLDAANEIAKSAGHTGLDTAGANTDQFFPGSGDKENAFYMSWVGSENKPKPFWDDLQSSHGDTLYIELTLSGTLGGRPLSWRACDRITLRNGVAIERESYLDPSPILAAVARAPRAWPRFLRIRARAALANITRRRTR